MTRIIPRNQKFDPLEQKMGFIVWDLDNKKAFHELNGYDIRAFTPDGRKAIVQSANRKEFAILDLDSETHTWGSIHLGRILMFSPISVGLL